RGSPDPALDPTAGLPNSDDETNPTNNANGDLRSNPAAGSGDTSPAQSPQLSGVIERLKLEEQKYARIELVVRSQQEPLKVFDNQTQQTEILRRLVRDQNLSYYLETMNCRVQETGATSRIVREETVQGRWWRQRIESTGPSGAQHSDNSLFVLPKPNHRLGSHTLALGYWLGRPESLSDIFTDGTPGRRKIVEVIGEETIDSEHCVKLKERSVSAGRSKFYGLLWLALDKNLLPFRSEFRDENAEGQQPVSVTQVTEWQEIQPKIWFPKRIESRQPRKSVAASDKLELGRTVSLTVELVTLQRGSPDPALDPTAGLPNSDDATNPTNNANGDLRSNPAAESGEPRRAQPKPEKYSAKLPNGVEVELAGVAMANVAYPDQPKRRLDDGWWRADGARLQAPPMKLFEYSLDEPQKDFREFAIKLIPAREAASITASHVSWTPDPPRGLSGASGWDKSDSEPGFLRLQFSAGFKEKDEKPVAVHVFISDQPQGPAWLIDVNGMPLPQKPADAQTDVLRKLIQIVGVEQTAGETIFRCKLPPNHQERMEFTVRAIDQRDQPHEFRGNRDTAAGAGRLFQLAAADIKHFEIRLRPMTQKATFENVSLVPEQMTDVKVKVEPINLLALRGLGFLQPYPKLHGLSLDMTEPQFLEIVKQQELKSRKTVEGEKATHHIALGDGHTLIVMFDKDAKCSGIQRVRGDDEAGARAWQRVEPYAAPSFDQFFPDDAEGGQALSKLWKAADKDTRDDRDILATVRKGLRRTTEHRTLILSWIGNKYIWNKSPQNADAIEIMYHAADISGEHADPYGTRHYAVYFGLSVVEAKSPAILRTLAELSMRVDDPNDLDRIAWGTRKQQQELIEYLKPFLASKEEAVRAKAEVCQQIFQGELKAFAWAAKQAKVRAEKKYASQLSAFKAVLESGSSEERRKTLDMIIAERIALIMDDSFVAAFAKCAADQDASIRESVAIVAGGRWVWESEQQHPDAIKLMVLLSTDTDREVRYNAVYYGLSTIKNKSDEVVRRLLEMAFADQEPNLRRRITWGLRGSEKQVVKLLDEYIKGPNQKQSEAAREFLKQWSSRAGREAPAAARAGRGSSDPALDPTAGLPDSDGDPKTTNNANGDLRSNPAAGWEDPRRAQGNSGGPPELRAGDDAIAPNGEIHGVLLGKDAQPVVGATVVCAAVINDSRKGGGARVVTDAEGRYRLKVPSPGIYIVWVKAAGAAGEELPKTVGMESQPTWTAAADDGLLVEAGKVTTSKMQLIRGTMMSGTLVDADDKPLKEATVYCYSLARPISGGTVQSMKTNDKGEFAFWLVPGRAYFYSTDEERGRTAVSIEVPRNGRPEPIEPLKLVLKNSPSKPIGDPEWLERSTIGTEIVKHSDAADVTGVVVDSEGQPIPGAKVFRHDGPIVTADEQGEFKVSLSRGSQHQMHAFHPGYRVWFGAPMAGDVLKIVLEKKSDGSLNAGPTPSTTTKPSPSNGSEAVPPRLRSQAESGNEQKKNIRTALLRFVGGEKQEPLVGLQVEFTHGDSSKPKRIGPFTTDDAGTIKVSLPIASYYLHLKSDKELPYLPVEAMWKGEKRGPQPDLSLAVTQNGVEKWLAGKKRDGGYEPPAAPNNLPRITYALLPACELTLRAVDAETGKGLPGIKVWEENAVGEDWAHAIYGRNIGSKFSGEREPLVPTPSQTDQDGNFRRFVSANAGFTYGCWKPPAGYEASSPGEVEIDIRYGQLRAEHVFKFRRIQQAVNVESKKQAATSGTLTGRFVFDGEPPVPRDLFSGIGNSPSELQPGERGSGVASTYRHYLELKIRPSTTDPSLLVGKDGGIANVIVWVVSKEIPWTAPQDGLKAATIRVKDGNYSPRFTAVTVGQPLLIENHDPVPFNFRLNAISNDPVNVLMPPTSIKDPLRLTFRKLEKLPVLFRSDQATWATGFLLVRDSPFVAISQPDGSFSMPNLPPGEWEFRAWHERKGYVQHWPKGLFKHAIKPGENSLGAIKLKPEYFRE
ncbi:MAG: hypothetical protein FD138_185, partial [Planctomycetota bacterium]